jgi:CelD/BcsL family acetyltransferase involved in cellulose biosynthesis
VARRGWERPVFRAFSEELHARADDWDLLDLLDLPTGALLSTSLKHAFRESSFEIRGSERFICPFEPLVPTQPFEAFLRQTSRGANYLRRRRWLESQKGFEIQIEVRPERLPLVLAEFFHLHGLRWQRDGGSQGIRSVEAEAFHRDATQFLAERGKIRFYTLRLQGQPLATVYGLVDRGKFLYFQSGYDPQWSKQSVGLVLVGETFRDSLASGLREYDFLHGTEPYKQEWTKQQRRTVNLRVFRRGGTGGLWNRREQLGARARGVLKQALPAPWADAIRRLRRRWAQA